ncbi:uncharacterized protein LOC143922896 [Arctopsyche grandis]|uniref:uncharacterized protein LOC143922896 n=1 Tax=Arctopsyche grandis TaxID=121162 RepID=UPI00406D85E9
MCRIEVLLLFLMTAVLVFSENLDSEMIPALFDWENNQFSTEPQKSNPFTILAVGGYNQDTSDIIEVYSPQKDSWSILGRTGLRVTQFSAIMLKKKLLIFGGRIDYKNTNEVWSYDLATKQTSKLPSMRKRRAFTTAAKIGRLIYVCGGTNINHKSVNVVEQFNPRTNTWTFKASMPTSRKNHGMAAWKGKLYVAGGFDQNYRRPNTLDIYNPELNQWTSEKLVHFFRVIFNLIPISDRLFAIGGAKEWAGRLRDERLNFVTNKWRYIADSPKPLFYTSAVAYEEKIIVVNKYNETYEYDSKINRWKTLRSRVVNRAYPNMLMLPKMYYKYVEEML